MDKQDIYKLILAKRISDLFDEIRETSKDPMVIETIPALEEAILEACFGSMLAGEPQVYNPDLLEEDEIMDGPFEDFLKAVPLTDDDIAETTGTFRFVLWPEEYM